MTLVFLTSVVSFLVAFICIPILIKFSYSKNIFDFPSAQKPHFYPVSFFGGIGIFVAIIFSMTAVIPFYNAAWLQYLLASSVIIFLLGIQDDILFLSPFKKFIGQMIAIFILVEQGHFQLQSLHGFLGFYQLNSVLSIVFTYLTILLIINAFNLIDGVDGLAGTLSLISTIFFAVVFLLENELVFAALSFSVTSALCAFLVYNYTPPKIFLGDTGSMLLGLLNAALVIKFINIETTASSLFHSDAAAAIGLAVLFIPIIDTIRVMAIRLYNRRSPFVGDQNHIHHLLLRKGYSHMKVTFILSISNALLIFYAIIFRSLGISFLVITTSLIYFVFIYLFFMNSGVNWFSEDPMVNPSENKALSDKIINAEGEIEPLVK
jgi:UDP-N-acetylmuramyl pentapeptide phosphotransferase/UDP-N-acetylglucosamine-1-phosphate transferase